MKIFVSGSPTVELAFSVVSRKGSAKYCHANPSTASYSFVQENCGKVSITQCRRLGVTALSQGVVCGMHRVRAYNKGGTLWPNCFHELRASFETQYLLKGYSMFVVSTAVSDTGLQIFGFHSIGGSIVDMCWRLLGVERLASHEAVGDVNDTTRAYME